MTSARIVVSLVPRGMDALERALEARAHRGADLVEVRLDAIADEVADGTERFARLLAGFGRPVIAALHGDEGFGGFEGGPERRRAALLAAWGLALEAATAHTEGAAMAAARVDGNKGYGRTP